MEISIIFFLDHISTFCKLWKQMRTKQLKKNIKNFSYKCVLELYFATITHQRPGRTKLSKSLYPKIHTVYQAGFEVKILRQLDRDISGTLVKVFFSCFWNEKKNLSNVRCRFFLLQLHVFIWIIPYILIWCCYITVD